MSYLDYYRQNPAWATNNWQSLAPPAPAFQPQPSWGGRDFFRAAVGGGSTDGGIYDYAQSRLQGLGSAGGMGMGFSMIEAKMMHRRAYGGLGDILTMAPSEIGAAAAYEVWRNWRFNYGVLAQPLSGDAMRQREALVGLAIGEATKLWQYTNRLTDNAGRMAAVESAAIAATRIFEQGNDMLMRTGGGGGGGGYSSMAGGAISPALSASGALGGMGMNSGMSGMSGMGGMGVMGGGMNNGLGGMGGSMSMGTTMPPFVRRRSRSVGAAPVGYGYGYGGGSPMAGGMGTAMAPGAGMYGGADGMLGANTGGGIGMGMGMGIQRPLSAGAGAYGVPPVYGGSNYGGSNYGGSNYGGSNYGGSNYGGSNYGGSDYGDPSNINDLTESALARHERHKAERAAFKEARRREREGRSVAFAEPEHEHEHEMGYGFPPRQRGSYDDNYAYEVGRRGGLGYAGADAGYGDGYGTAGYGTGYGTGYGDEYSRHGHGHGHGHRHRRHRAEREAERYALEGGAGMYGGGRPGYAY